MKNKRKRRDDLPLKEVVENTFKEIIEDTVEVHNKWRTDQSEKCYIIESPDGFRIERGKPYYNTFEEAVNAYIIWAERFKVQGYYSSNKGRIPLDELIKNCHFEILLVD